MVSPGDAYRRGDGLLLVDVQLDFCPGGALPVAGGGEVVPLLNGWLDSAPAAQVPVYASRDWHPDGHPSFRSHGGSWPAHCVQDTPGAAFHPELRLPAGTAKVAKGVRFDRDQYSAFDETGLATRLRQDGVELLWLGGLALDVCVLATALDARSLGFEVVLLANATRAVEPSAVAATLERLRESGVRIEQTA